jgi:uroporphyrinogen-III synthase
VLIVRGERGRDWLAETLRARGAEVQTLAAYARGAAKDDAGAGTQLQQALAAPARHLWLLASAEGVASLQAMAPGADWRAAHALAPHPRIAAAARAAGFGAVAEVPADPAAVAAWVSAHPPCAH